MILRQTYLDPVKNRLEIKEVELRLEDVRLPGEANPRIRIIGFCQEMSSMAEPIDQIHYILDSKRTYAPPSTPMTRVVGCEGGKIFCYDNGPKGLNADVGDPVAVLESIKKVHYGVVTDADEFSIEMQFAKEVTVKAGNILQNLRQRLFVPTTQLGITSHMSQPEGLGLVSHVSRDSVMVMVTPPLNPGRMECFDVYARDRAFDVIDPYWWPDSYDINIREEQVSINTYNGGATAGGGTMQPGKTYWVTAIAKDRKGFGNVNESPAQFVEKVRLPD